MEAVDLAAALTRNRRVVVVTNDPVSAVMAGPAIRAWHLAEVLAGEGHEVVLASTASADVEHPDLVVEHVDEARLRRRESWCDVLVFQGGLLHLHPFVADSEKPLVADLYDPFHLENLEHGRGTGDDHRHGVIEHLVRVLNEPLSRADFVLCASERQRDFWIGGLAALGRANPATYDEDPTLRALIDVVPFGIDPDAPLAPGPAIRGVIDGIGADAQVLLWAGGVYNWFDPLTLVRSVAALRTELPRLRLFFLGMSHPNPAVPAMETAVALRRLVDELELGDIVHFNETWVPYDERGRYLLDADVGVSTHLDHLETSFSFRTRMLDYLWAGLPMISTAGDHFADEIERHGLGATVPPQDAEGLAAAIRTFLVDDERRLEAGAAARRLAREYSWEKAARPLVDFCAAPRVAPDRARRLEHARQAAAGRSRAEGGLAQRLRGRLRSS